MLVIPAKVYPARSRRITNRRAETPIHVLFFSAWPCSFAFSITQINRGPVMNVCSSLAEIVRHGTTRNPTSRQPKGGRRPQIETLEERAVPTLNLPTDPSLFAPIDADHHHHMAVHMQA